MRDSIYSIKISLILLFIQTHATPDKYYFGRKFIAWHKVQEMKGKQMLHAVFHWIEFTPNKFILPSFSCLQVVKGATLFSAAVTWGQFLIRKSGKEKNQNNKIPPVQSTELCLSFALCKNKIKPLRRLKLKLKSSVGTNML